VEFMGARAEEGEQVSGRVHRGVYTERRQVPLDARCVVALR
jgi:hypothetical protein